MKTLSKVWQPETVVLRWVKFDQSLCKWIIGELGVCDIRVPS